MTNPSIILGVSAFYHDSAASLVRNGEIIAAAQEERFSRKKHDASFPKQAIDYVLKEAGLSLHDVAIVAYYEKPYIKFERLLETYHEFAPMGLRSFLSAIPVWIKEKVFLKKIIRDQLKESHNYIPEIVFPDHHLSHAASAFYPSPFQEAAILTLDGVGEWATTTIGYGKGNNISIIKELQFPHSLGLLYSAFTYYCGFKVNSGEYKLMGLAPYGNPQSDQTKSFNQKIKAHLIDSRDDGSFLLNMEFFNYPVGLTMTKDKKWNSLFGFKRRLPESPLTQDIMNLALAIQQVTEEGVLKLAQTAKSITKSNYLVMAGGVALNCVANGKLLKEKIFDDVWIQPASGDAGGALGAALAVWHIMMKKDRILITGSDVMKGSLLGPQFSDKAVQNMIRNYNTTATYYDQFDLLCDHIVDEIDKGCVVGWFQGAMEFGPRALGNRSILADSRKLDMQKKLNLKIKYREGFRPFAPIVLEERISEYFELDRPSPYMLVVAPVKQNRCYSDPNTNSARDIYDRLYHFRSDIPAVTHIDYSARVQTVNKQSNYRLWKLLKTFEKKTGCPVLINTSFNIRGEPIVCTPEDAYRCFIKTEMDYLVMGNYIFKKKS